MGGCERKQGIKDSALPIAYRLYCWALLYSIQFHLSLTSASFFILISHPHLKIFLPGILNSGSFPAYVPMLFHISMMFFRLYFLYEFPFLPIQFFSIFKTQLRHYFCKKTFLD